MKRRFKYHIVLLLHNIRSAYNVGAMFRTADAVGVSQIYLTGYSPCPTDRFDRPNVAVAKSALGAEKHVPWKHSTSASLIIHRLKSEGYKIIAIEQNPKATHYKKYKARGKIVLIVGNELDGVTPKLLGMSDKILEIPMRGKKESLNVSVALGVVLFAISSL